MSEPRIIEQLDPYERDARINAREDILAAKEIVRLAALPVKDYEPILEITRAAEPIDPRRIRQLDPHEVDARIKARKDAEAAREILRLAALPVEEYDPMPGPEAIPQSFDEQGREISYLEMFPVYPKPEYPCEVPLSFEMGDPRAAIQSPYKMTVPEGDAELPPGYPGRVTPSPTGQYAVSSTGPIEVTRLR